MLPFIDSLPRQTLLLALLLALLGDQLGFGAGFTGPVVLIWLSLFIIAATWLACHQRTLWSRQLPGWGSVAILAAALRLLVAYPEVDVALFLAMTVAAAQILLRTANISFRQADVFQQTLAHITLPVQAWIGGFSILGHIEFKPASRHPAVMGGLKGLLLALPLLLIFSLLFSAADVTFEHYLAQLDALLSPTLLEHLLLILLLGWLTLGLLAAAWQPRKTLATPSLPIKLGDTEIIVMMGLLALLFVAFAALQASHLLRDGTGIAQTTGLAIAEYARHGFFQLLWIAALALGMLLLLANCCRNQRLFGGFAALLLVCVLIVLASAVQRMLFYIDSFGLSIDRIVASMVMLWLAGSLLLFAATMLRNRPEGFVSGVASLGVLLCLGLALVNPAALVTRINIERSLNQQLSLDLDYLYKLGADAVPVMLDYLPQLAPALQCEVSAVLIQQWLAHDNDNVVHLQDWRRWNYAYYRAQATIQTSSEQLLAAARRSGDPYYSNRDSLRNPAPLNVSCQ